ncbi:MAG: tetrahydromethanopterin S-methyltransferase subunit A, partial [Deltaproteobacteria bacterium]
MVQQKVNLPGEYPPEKGRYARGNDYSPVVVCVILDTFDFNIPPELEELVMAGLDTGAALSGMLQTENIGLEKMICNIVANPNIRYIVLCGRETAGHLTGQSLLALMENGVNAK